MRGDRSSRSCARRSARGSPPRARGPRVRLGMWLPGRGITPACAGTAWWCAAGTCWCRDHPRVRGDRSRCAVRSASSVGSPPRARGPHVLAVRQVERRVGSPPRARGPRSPRPTRPGISGITPACAGTAPRVSTTTIRAWDHPRVRGDRDLRIGWGLSGGGSPPRARGPLRGCAGRRVGAGITPACAGTAPSRACRPSWTRDHPRVRGDRTSPSPRTRARRGSPPRARGPLCAVQGGPDDHGITPACAGTAVPCTPGTSGPGDHPRVRGDRYGLAGLNTPNRGSPPRARGPQRGGHLPVAAGGITPACAGCRLPR